MAPEDPRVKARKELDGGRLADFLDDAAYLVGGNGAPLIQGRSLIYRFAAAAGQKDLGGVLAGASRATVVSLTRGAVELRLVRVRGTSPGTPGILRIGGWPVDAQAPVVSEIRPLAGWGSPLDDAGTWHREAPHPMGERLTIPWIGTPAAVADGDYAAVVVLAGKGTTDAAAAVRFVADGGPGDGGGRFEFADGIGVDLAAVLEGLTSP